MPRFRAALSNSFAPEVSTLSFSALAPRAPGIRFLVPSFRAGPGAVTSLNLRKDPSLSSASASALLVLSSSRSDRKVMVRRRGAVRKLRFLNRNRETASVSFCAVAPNTQVVPQPYQKFQWNPLARVRSHLSPQPNLMVI